ncbi:PASTA domain-containing protein [Alicyclobacillus curvatus]|nr:PASTA domain-containing protein [Alicyclobacillus curvatus]
MYFIQLGLLTALGAVIYRISFVQSTFGPGLLASAAKVQDVNRIELAQRGALLDRNGNMLAYDVPAYMLDIKTDAFKNLSSVANALAPVLGTSQSALLQSLKSAVHWRQWPTPILATTKDKVNQVLAALGKADKTDYSQDVTYTPTEQRFYPYGSFAANTIGFVDHSGTGVNGLEAQYNKQLSGTNGEITYTQDLWGMPIQSTVHTVKPPAPGDNLETTIDQTIQGFVEQDMNQLVQNYKPEHAAIIVMDPKTGGILAMASRPTFNPNQYGTASSTALNNNWAVDASFEPGSTFKVLTLAAALATNSINLNHTFMSGHTTIAGRTIYDWNMVGWGVLTYRQALEMSSNVGFAKIAEKVGWPNLIHYMQVFGFLNPTGIDLPGEATSQIFPPSARNAVELATSGFGQGISVTPLQQMVAYAAIANGGKLIRPHLAKALIDPTTGKVVKQFAPVIENPQVVPKSVAAEINQTLVLDVTKGIDTTAAIPGYQVAGKTGTANVVDPKTGKYYSNRFTVSFMGYAPASNPQYEVYVTVNWPKTPIGKTWGSTIAAPTATDILQKCLQYGHVPPDDPATLPKVNPAQVTKGKGPHAVTMTTVPALNGLTIAAAKSRLVQLGLSPQIVGTGTVVGNVWPSPGLQVAKGSKVYAVANGGGGSKIAMPDFTGASVRVAMSVLSELGLTADVSGVGYVTSQSVKPGQLVTPGSVLKLVCQVP